MVPCALVPLRRAAALTFLHSAQGREGTMKITQWTAVIVLLFCTTSPLHAQWLKHPTPGSPKSRCPGAPHG